MKKDLKTIHIPQKKAFIVGTIISLIYAIVGSYMISDIIGNSGSFKGQVDIFIFALPGLFIVFETFILGFIYIFRNKKDEPK